MKQCEQGLIKMIYGRLGDLATIDEKYDIAISTACPGLDDIVVDTMQTAVQCVEFLKKHDLGSATFIALDKVICEIVHVIVVIILVHRWNVGGMYQRKQLPCKFLTCDLILNS